MENIQKNRFRIEDPEAKEFVEDWGAPLPGNEGDDWGKRRKSKLPLFLVIFTVLIVCAAAGYATYVFYLKKKVNQEELAESVKSLAKDGRSLELLLDKPYLPDDRGNRGVANCLQLYKDRYVNKAFKSCEEFLNTPGKDEDKSIALTVIGVMFDEAGRYVSAIERLTKAIQYDSKNFYAYYNLALAYKHTGRLDEAKKAALRAKEIAPQDARISLLNGNLFSEIGDPDKAVEAYKEGQSLSPDDPTLAYNLAMSYYRQGNLPQAIEEFKKASLIAPTSYVAVLSYGHLGAIYYSREDFEKSEFYFREAVRLKPGEAKYHYNLGLVFWKKNLPEEAIKSFQRALDAGSNEPEVFRNIADAFSTLGQTSLAISALQKGLLIRPHDTDSLFMLAELYYKKGELIEAEKGFRKIVQSTPGDSFTETAYINLGIVLDEMERYSEAIPAFESAISLNPKNQSAYYNLGLSYLHAGSPTKAIESFRKSSSLDPNHYPSRLAIGDYFLENKYYAEAIQEYEQVIGEKPDLHEARLKLAEAYSKTKSYPSAEKSLLYVLENAKEGSLIKMAHRKLAVVYSESGNTGSGRKAKEEAFRATHMDPSDMESKLVLAKILIDSGSLMDREKAIDELTVVVRSDVTPSVSAKAHNYMGVCYFKNGEFKKAMQSFQMAIDLDPNLTEAYNNKRSARAQYEQAMESKKRNLF